MTKKQADNTPEIQAARLKSKSLPFSHKQVLELIKKYPTPFYIYDEEGIRKSARALKNTFSWSPDFKNYFAVKALPNPEILKILKNEGMGADCSSLPELILAKMVGLHGEEIMFTSNDTPAEEFKKARELGAVINLDDISHISFLEKHIGIPNLISFRYNPGPLRRGNSIIGKPEEAKYGLTRDQLFEAYKIMKEKGVQKFGLHTMIASNELNPSYFVETAKMIFELVGELYEKIAVKIDFINMGGGIGIPYKPGEQTVDLKVIKTGVSNLYQEMILKKEQRPLKITMECGRVITGPHGYLVSKVRHLKNTYRQYVGLDSCMTNLMRPALYGAYHHITVLGKENEPYDQIYDVTGSLCENNDKFAIQRRLPKIEPDDIVVIHDAGAHGHAMGFQYNGKLRCAEFLMESNKNFRMIRRAETIDDYFATLVNQLKNTNN
jgi:diaminopimelate decarboxylase